MTRATQGLLFDFGGSWTEEPSGTIEADDPAEKDIWLYYRFHCSISKAFADQHPLLALPAANPI